MKVTIDSLGRIVIPKRFRKALGLVPRSEMEMDLRGRSLVLEPLEAGVSIVETEGGLKIIRGLPPITHEEMERIKRNQYEHRFQDESA